MAYVQYPNGEVYQTDSPDVFAGAVRISDKEGKRLYVSQHRDSLLKRLKPGQRVYTILRSVSSSGMSRSLSVLIVTGPWQVGVHIQPAEIADITYSVAIVAGYRRNKRGHIVVGGCGFDTGHDVVYSLGRALWPEGTPEPHGNRNGKPDSDGGYALNHSWL